MTQPRAVTSGIQSTSFASCAKWSSPHIALCPAFCNARTTPLPSDRSTKKVGRSDTAALLEAEGFLDFLGLDAEVVGQIRDAVAGPEPAGDLRRGHAGDAGGAEA